MQQRETNKTTINAYVEFFSTGTIDLPIPGQYIQELSFSHLGSDTRS